MASVLTSELAKAYVVKLIDGPRYICCFTRIVKDYEEEKSRLETFIHHLDVATRRGEDVQDNTLFWAKEADKLIQEDTKTKQKCLFGFCPHIMWRYKRGKELTNKKELIKRLMETGMELSIALPARLADVERYSSQHFIHFKSRESKYKELLDALKDDNNYITGLQGMGGTGKTTLAKEVGKALKESKQFTKIIDTTVSFSPDIKKIQDDIAGPLGLKIHDSNELDRPKKLWSRLTNGEKILLILDDVWGDIDFNEIGIPSNDNHKGCRILVTTRSLLVCKRLRCSKTIQLELLSDEEAWTMFQRHAGLTEISTKSLLDKGRKIANECKGLPIAIASIASRLMGEQRPEVWDVALKEHLLPDGDTAFEIYKILKLSYDNMKNEKAKRLFLLCSVFQEDENIPIEMVTRLGIGAGLFGEDYGSYEDGRCQAVFTKNKLLDSCLLLEANHNKVKMPYLGRDAAQRIANYEIQTVKLDGKNQKEIDEKEKNIKYLFCEGKLMDVFSYNFDGSKLEILIVTVYKDEDCRDVKNKVPNSFFENNNDLRVFHLLYDHYCKLSLSLPRSIESLKNIRSLLFTLVDLGNISTLANLQSLETLDLKDCKIDELPHGIAKLEKFRLLNLECCIIERNNPFEVIERCSLLEELYFTGSFNASCREITFLKLRRFCIDEHRRSVNDASSKYVSVVENDELFLSATTFNYCMQEAEVLRLNGIETGWRNLIPEIVSMDQGMNDIVELSLSCNSQLQHLIDTNGIGIQVPNVFLSELVVLKLDRMDNLEELFNGPVSFESLSNLEEISIKDCKHLKILFKCKVNLTNLRIIKLQNCPMLVSLFQVQNVFLSKLVVLKLDRMENLEQLFNGPVSFDSLKNLEEISIKDCKHLNSLFKCQINLYNLKIIKLQNCPMLVSVFQLLTSRSLVSLEKLQIANCEGLENIVTYEKREEESRGEIDVDNDKKSRESMFSKLKVIAIEECPRLQYIFPFLSAQSHPAVEAIRIRRCDKLKYIIGQDHSELSYRLHIWEYVLCLPIQSYSMCNIKEINLSHFCAIKSLFILSITPRMSLEILTIENCDELKNIIIDDNRGNNWGDVFPKLKSIYVKDCIQFEYIFGYYDGDYQNHNEIHLHLPALKDINLCNLPGLVAMCTKQYRPTFPPLVELKLNGCPHAAIKSFHDFKIRRLESLNSIKKEHGDDQLPMTSFSIATTETNDQGDPSLSQIHEDLSSSLVVTKELENLVSKNHLAIENLSLLTDFLVKHPSVHLKDPSLSNRYKGYAYNCLAELLKFLKPHNVLDVVGSSHSEFVELLQDVRRFPFDKEWLDGVEKVVGLKTHID